MQPAKVPQHLELDDVVAWGLGAVDLLWVIAGIGGGWWLYLTLPGETAPRALAAVPLVMLGAAFGVVRIADHSLRQWSALALAFLARPRLLVTEGVA